MKKYLISIGILFVLHTLEETLFSFWNTDYFTLLVSSRLNIPAVVIYVGIQVGLYLFLAYLIFGKSSRVALFVLGFILLFELTHIVVAISSHSYTPGLLTGILLLIAALPFFSNLLNTKKVI